LQDITYSLPTEHRQLSWPKYIVDQQFVCGCNEALKPPTFESYESETSWLVSYSVC